MRQEKTRNDKLYEIVTSSSAVLDLVALEVGLVLLHLNKRLEDEMCVSLSIVHPYIHLPSIHPSSPIARDDDHDRTMTTKRSGKRKVHWVARRDRFYWGNLVAFKIFATRGGTALELLLLFRIGPVKIESIQYNSILHIETFVSAFIQ